MDAALFIRIATVYLTHISQILVEVIIKVQFEKIDLAKYLSYYFRGLDSISDISTTRAEIDLLNSYDDSTLRTKMASCIDHVPANEIEREMKKPHGGFEISDMELKVKINENMVYLCMPFKTGKEIKSDTVPVDVFYQLLRPFFHFNNCAVVFITAKGCSQNLLNEIKRAYDKYSFSIEVIEKEQLAKLLKINGQLN